MNWRSDERYHVHENFPDTEPLPRQEAPMCAYDLAWWCVRHRKLIGKLPQSAAFAVVGALLVLAGLRAL